MTNIITNFFIISFFLFFFFFPKDSLEITIYLKIPEVWYGSCEPILSHSEAKKYLYPSLELWKFKNEFWNDICVISLYGHIPESVRSPTLISLHKRQITLSSFKKGQIKKGRLGRSHCNSIANSFCQRWNIMNLLCTQSNPLCASLPINRTKVKSTVNITGKSHLAQRVSEARAGLFTAYEKSINKMLCPCKMKCE